MGTTNNGGERRKKAIIRRASHADNDQLLALCRECPLQGDLTLWLDRSPNFFRIFEILDDNPRVLVWDDDGRIGGVIAAVHRQFHVAGRRTRCILIREFKVAPKYRKGLAGHRLVRELVRQEQAAGTELAVLSYVKNNDASVPFLQGRARIPAGRELGSYLMHSVVALKQVRTGNSCRIDAMQASDVDEVVALLNDNNTRYEMSPRFDTPDFEKLLDSFAGRADAEVLVARRNGAIEAAAGWWDSHDVAKYTVLGCSSMQLRAAWWAHNVLRGLRRLPMTSLVGNSLRFKHIVLAACASGRETALATLLREFNNSLYGSQYSHFSIALHERNPHNRLLEGLIKISIPHTMMAFQSDSADPLDLRALDDSTPYVDVALYI